MSTPFDPTTPRYPDQDQRDRNRPEYHDRAVDRGSDGMGAIVAIVALATLVIVGLLYFMQSASEAPGRVTSEAPPATAPAPLPPRPSEPVK